MNIQPVAASYKFGGWSGVALKMVGFPRRPRAKGEFGCFKNLPLGWRNYGNLWEPHGTGPHELAEKLEMAVGLEDS